MERRSYIQFVIYKIQIEVQSSQTHIYIDMNEQDRSTITVTSMEMEMAGSGENTPIDKINKIACACAVVASIISIIFGYGNV